MRSGSLGAPANASGYRYEETYNQYTGISYMYRNWEIYENHYVGSRSHLKDIFHFERNFNNVIK